MYGMLSPYSQFMGRMPMQSGMMPSGMPGGGMPSGQPMQNAAPQLPLGQGGGGGGMPYSPMMTGPQGPQSPSGAQGASPFANILKDPEKMKKLQGMLGGMFGNGVTDTSSTMLPYGGGASSTAADAGRGYGGMESALGGGGQLSSNAAGPYDIAGLLSKYFGSGGMMQGTGGLY